MTKRVRGNSIISSVCTILQVPMDKMEEQTSGHHCILPRVSISKRFPTLIYIPGDLQHITGPKILPAKQINLKGWAAGQIAHHTCFEPNLGYNENPSRKCAIMQCKKHPRCVWEHNAWYASISMP